MYSQSPEMRGGREVVFGFKQNLVYDLFQGWGGGEGGKFRV